MERHAEMPPRSPLRTPDSELRHNCDRIDIDAATILIEAHFALDERVDREVTADSHVFAGVPLGTALTENDVTGNNGLTAELLHATALALAIATVLDTALSFFMRHD